MTKEIISYGIFLTTTFTILVYFIHSFLAKDRTTDIDGSFVDKQKSSSTTPKKSNEAIGGVIGCLGLILIIAWVIAIGWEWVD